MSGVQRRLVRRRHGVTPAWFGTTSGSDSGARWALRDWCRERVDDELLLDAELLVSELATNALLHGEGPITLRAHLDNDRLLVELIDEGTGFERDLRHKDFRQIGG